jgi:hypothetical protein
VSLAEMSDDELARAAESAILDAAVMNRTRWSGEYHDRCDEVYAECAKRSRGIYQRAWNAVVRSQGHDHMAHQVNGDGA